MAFWNVLPAWTKSDRQPPMPASQATERAMPEASAVSYHISEREAG